MSTYSVYNIKVDNELVSNLSSFYTFTASISGTFTQSLDANNYVYTLTGNTTFGYSNPRTSTYNFMINAGTNSFTLQSGLFKTIGGTWSGLTGSFILSGVYDGSRMWIASTTKYNNL